MATVTAYTAARSQEIEDSTVVDGSIVGNDLVLETRDGTLINAGNVRGATGSPGISNAELNAGLDLHIPIGSSIEYVGTTAPNANFILMQGQTVVNAQSLYATLWGRIPTAWKSGTSMIVPDARKRVGVCWDSTDTDFDAIGEVGGAKTHTLIQAELPNSTVSVDPPATAVTGSVGNDTPSHVHVLGGATSSVDPPPHFHYGEPDEGISQFVMVTPGGPHAIDILYPGGGTTVTLQSATYTNSVMTHNHPLPAATGAPTAFHQHPAGSLSVNIAPFNSGALGSNSPHNNLQPYMVLNRLLKVL